MNAPRMQNHIQETPYMEENHVMETNHIQDNPHFVCLWGCRNINIF